MHIGSYIGLLGDFLSLLGGVLLAREAMQKAEEFAKIKALSKVRQAIGLVLEHDGVIIKNEKDVELAFIRHTVRQAVWGFRFLVLGFGFQAASRILEIIRDRALH